MFKVDQIDHVELFVPDRREAARWYERTLGLAVLSQYEDWAEDPHGPLMISSDARSLRGRKPNCTRDSKERILVLLVLSVLYVLALVFLPRRLQPVRRLTSRAIESHRLDGALDGEGLRDKESP